MKPLVSLGALLVVVASVAAEDKPKPKETAFDASKLVGEWTYTAGTKQGEKVPGDRLAGKVVITRDTLTLPAGGEQKFVIAYKLDAKKNPVRIDLDIKDGPVKEGKALGIIALKGNELHLCYTMADAKRPAKFESTKDNGAFYFVLKRAK